MFGLTRSKDQSEALAKLNALNKSLAVIEFDLDGLVITANQNFLSVMGYSLPEIQGRHHRTFVDPATAAGPEYAQFWEKLRRGEYQATQFKRIAKGGREVWIEASYNPILDANGRPYKVVKFATDITERKAREADLLGQVNALSKSLAVIEFDLDGLVITANQNFLSVMGYSLPEIQGRHHRTFVDPATAAGPEYAQFWEKLRRGEYQATQFKRIAKGGREVWIEASYNPILDANGRPYKVVKFATDITAQIDLLNQLKTLIDQNFGEIAQALHRSDTETGSAMNAATETSAGVQTVAAAAEELASSTLEISNSMAKSRSMAEQAQTQAEAADQATQKMSDAARQMNGIVDLIRSIAGQINLLALNATIEAARAGEAGRGFAVVATEVKNLANQAARATDQISSEIDAMQSISGDVVVALTGIRSSISSVRDYVLATASAVEEQTAVTTDMSRSMQGASSAVSAITGNIGEIVSSIHQVSAAVGKTKEAARVLAR
ncbi:methyl-accepting chemotaxis sensory transducer with Pas/Pac sensor [Azospirillum brasilense]|uniref:Methyl-accepting chemotaxis sensory transducer with Pas/Pac sensor n=2 Tax=Azospirillum brasilense TaxID=192 RepID=A0A560AEM3_AZOBR|nr:PAS domain-containing methyl-accepting chemotaxis protein [Azospirillum brasilense]TWA58809.1 methyl-accepting chemotaxis sensory transducer with Pas/Pac sensor [Azospirillum brasilense]